MLQFYYHPLSPIARRVWIALLEKGIPFESALVDLRGEQNKPAFLALNPFHHVPVVVDEGRRIIESLAILDYLEARYPTPTLTRQDPVAIAHMRMVQMVTVNELMPKLPTLALASQAPDLDADLAQHLATTFTFLAEQLGDAEYFGGATLSLADVTTGSLFPLLHRLGTDFTGYPAIARWYERLVVREAWQQTEPADDLFEHWLRWIQLQLQRRQRQVAATAS